MGVTRPHQLMMQASTLRPHFAAPFGDMMLAGCYGLLSAAGGVLPALKDQIKKSLSLGGQTGSAPWEFD